MKKPEKQDWDDLDKTPILRQHYVTEATSRLLKWWRTSRKGCQLKERLERWTIPLWRYRWFRFVAINFLPIPCIISIIMALGLLMFCSLLVARLLTLYLETVLIIVPIVVGSLALLLLLGLLVWLYLIVRKCIQSYSRKCCLRVKTTV